MMLMAAEEDSSSPQTSIVMEEEKMVDVQEQNQQRQQLGEEKEEEPPPPPEEEEEGRADTTTMDAGDSVPNNAGADDDDSPPPRLMITKLVLENFKSYGGVQVIDQFHHRFSAIVGPNGSGKSNVIDALLFVFGKRAKQLRLNKVSELIHNNSSSGVDRPTSARVSVHFQEIVDCDDDGGQQGVGGGGGDDTNAGAGAAESQLGFRVVPGSECVLSRIARSDNTSVYQLNGKSCPFRTVASYLEKKGLDLDNNRFLILQGEVEMISMMPPRGKTPNDTGLLEYLEEIIGSSKFVEDTESAAADIERLSQTRQEKLQRVKATQQELEGLGGAKREAMALLHVQREIARKKNVLYQLQGGQAEMQGRELQKRHDRVLEELQAKKSEIRERQGRLDELQGGSARQQAEYDRVHEELVETKEKFSAFERKDIKLKEEIKHLKATQKKMEKKISTEGTKHRQAVEKKQAAMESIPALEEKVERLSERKAAEDEKLDAIYASRQEETQGLRSRLEKKTEELAPLKQELAVYRNDRETAESEVQLLQDSCLRAQAKLDQAESELSALDANQQAKREELATSRTQLESNRSRLQELAAEDETLQKDEETLAGRNRQLTARAEEAKAALQSKGGGRPPAVDGILRAARPGGELAKVGILGRLGDLATIAEPYDVAVSTACSMLNHIVVHTTAGAQKCLAFLRKHNLGRANFIPLDKMKKGAHDRVVETPENAPRLFNLINVVNFAVAPALYLAVGNTLVAPDLETATRWAYDYGKRWRVVTVDGKLIETSGTMSGGGKSVRKGGMKLANGRSASSSTSSVQAEDESQDCKRLEQEAAKTQQLLQDCRQRRKEVADEIRNLKKAIKALEIKLPKLEMEIKGFDTTRSELTKIIPGLQSQCQLSESDEAKLAELNAKVEKCKSDMSSCEQQTAKVEAEVAALQKAILDAGGPELKKQQKTCEKVLSELNKTEKELSSAKVAVTTNGKAGVKAQEAQAAAEQQLEECKKTMEETKEDIKALEADALEVMQAFEQVKETEAKKREALEAVTRECEELQKSLSDVKVVEVELTGKLDAYEKQLSECEKKKKHWAGLVDKLRSDMEDDDMDLLSDDEDEEDGASNDGSSGTSPASKKSTADDGDDGSSKGDRSDAEMQDSIAGTDDGNETAAASKSALPTYSHETLEKYSKEEIQNEINVLETERNTIAKNANMGAIAEYRKKEGDYLARVSELDAVTEERNAARKTYDDLRRMRLEMFMDGFGKITLKLKEMYQMITLGGDAELELVDSLDPFSEGIVFSVRPPKKSWKNISNLSGGEKTLSSLALVFALHHFKPTPLYVMDEIDAALDFKNVSIVANYIKDRTKNAQFVIVSLRNNMFELADRLVGIYKTNNCTKSVTIDPQAFGVPSQQNGFAPTTPALADNANKNRGTSVVKSKAKDSVRRRVSFQSQAVVS